MMCSGAITGKHEVISVSGTLTSEDELLPSASVHKPGPLSSPLPDLIPSSDHTPSSDLTSDPALSPPPSSDLHWALQLVFTHFRRHAPPPPPPPRKGGRTPRRDLTRGRGARPRERPGGGGGDRSGAVSEALRHVGEELRRIADQLQLNKSLVSVSAGSPTGQHVLIIYTYSETDMYKYLNIY